MTRRPQTLVLALAAITALTISTAQAALVSINTTTLSADGAEITSLGSVVHAWNVNGDAGTATVNGIAFTDVKPSDIAVAGFPASGSNNTATAAHYTDTDLGNIMESNLGTNFNNPAPSDDAIITISSLDVGQLYQVQFTHQQDINASSGRGFKLRFGGSGGTAGSASYNQAGNNLGYISTVLFVADATSQIFYLDSQDIAGNRAPMNSVSVTTIPAPAALPAGLALLGLGLLRRRPQ